MNEQSAHLKKTTSSQPPQSILTTPEYPTQQVPSSATIERAQLNVRSLLPEDVLQLQRVVGNRAMSQLLAQSQGRALNDQKPARRPASVTTQTAKTPVAIQRTSHEVIQRNNDKVAVEFGTLPNTTEEEAEVQRIQSGLQDIYNRHRSEKTNARKQLDLNYQTQSANLEARQDYLFHLVNHKACTDLNAKYTFLSLTIPPVPTIPATTLSLSDQATLANEADIVVAKILGVFSPWLDGKAEREKAVNEGRELLEADLPGKIEDRIKAANYTDTQAVGFKYLKSKVTGWLVNELNKTYSGLSLTLSAPKVPEPGAEYKKILGQAMRLVGSEITELNVSEKVNEIATEESGLRPYFNYMFRKKLKENPDEVPAPNQALIERLDNTGQSIVAQVFADVKSRAQELTRLAALVAKAESVDTDKVKMYSQEHARHHLADPIVQSYEEGYMNSGLNMAAVYRDWSRLAKENGYYLWSLDDGKKTELRLHRKKGGQEFKVGTLYEGDERFVESSIVTLGTGEKREVFKHREKNREYVQDIENQFVKRYVKRALNEYDNPSTGGVDIKSDSRKKKDTNKTWKEIAEEVPNLPRKERDREVWKHQREKELQGGSPFVSTTTTDHPIFGSTAKSFESEHGVAEIDLAKISKDRILDTHTPRAYKRITGVDKPDPKMPFKENDLGVEKNSAARDAMRTREVVVIGDVPLDAIMGVSQLESGSTTRTQ